MKGQINKAFEMAIELESSLGGGGGGGGGNSILKGAPRKKKTPNDCCKSYHFGLDPTSIKTKRAILL